MGRYLGVDVHGGEPASETGMGVVPSDDDLCSLGLLEHVEHVLLVDWIHRFNRDGGSALGHGEDVDYLDGVVIDDLADEEAHDL